ncbi:MAG TPA: helix-turn-helix domain-containing protein [Vicinamibacteria bacterium]
MRQTEHEERTTYLTRAGVALLLGVSPNTVSRWAREGKLTCQLTLGGHRRFDRREIEELSRRMRAEGGAAAR